MMLMATELKAVIFDLGGVILESPLHVITRLEAERGWPQYFLARVIGKAGLGGAWQKLERGELDIASFCEVFDHEIGRELAVLGATPAPGFSASLMVAIAEATLVRPNMIEAVRRLRRAGRKVGALTNNWQSSDGQYDRMQELSREFDIFIESCKVKMRKPDPRIYELACRELGVVPAEAAFVDDIGENLKAARALGMVTIKCADPDTSLRELGTVVGLDLLG
jgi:epoxide hydrolase-like predicted phosphatase